jgi:hypothetical protein
MSMLKPGTSALCPGGHKGYAKKAATTASETVAIAAVRKKPALQGLSFQSLSPSSIRHRGFLLAQGKRKPAFPLREIAGCAAGSTYLKGAQIKGRLLRRYVRNAECPFRCSDT